MKRFLTFFTMLIMLLLVACGGKANDPADTNAPDPIQSTTVEIAMPMSSGEFIGLNHQDAYKKFQILGFSQIEYVGTDDLTSKEIDLDELVDSVSIEGKSEFSLGDSFSSDSRVTIHYRTLRKISVPISSSEITSENISESLNTFVNAGFCNIKSVEVEDIDPNTGENTAKVDITVGGKPAFMKGESIPFDTEIVLTIHRIDPQLLNYKGVYLRDVRFSIPKSWTVDEADQFFLDSDPSYYINSCSIHTNSKPNVHCLCDYVYSRRESASIGLQEYLEERDAWFDTIKDLFDSFSSECFLLGNIPVYKCSEQINYDDYVSLYIDYFIPISWGNFCISFCYDSIFDSTETVDDYFKTDEMLNDDIMRILRSVVSTSTYPYASNSKYEAEVTEAPDILWTTTGKENGLSGSIYSFYGSVVEKGSMDSEDGNVEYIIVNTSQGKVLVTDIFGYLVEQLREINPEAAENYCQQDYALPETGAIGRFICVYFGYSEKFDMPSCYLGAHEEIVEMVREGNPSLQTQNKTPEKEKPSADVVRPEVKEAIDSYEEFIDQYCEFMKRYDSTNTEMLMEYIELLSKEVEMVQNFEKIGEADLTDAELLYYTEVSLRCTQKMADCANSMN